MLIFSFGFSPEFFQSRIRCKVNKCCFSTHALADLPVGGIVDVPLAQTGEGIAECELLKWFVRQASDLCFLYLSLFMLFSLIKCLFSDWLKLSTSSLAVFTNWDVCFKNKCLRGLMKFQCLPSCS